MCMYDMILTVHWAALSGLWDSRSSMSSSRDSLDLLQTAPSIDEDDSDAPASPFDDDMDLPKTPTPDSPFTTEGSPFERRRYPARRGGLNQHPRNATSMPEMMQTIGNHCFNAFTAGTIPAAAAGVTGQAAGSAAAPRTAADDMSRVWGADKVELSTDPGGGGGGGGTNGYQKQNVR